MYSVILACLITLPLLILVVWWIHTMTRAARAPKSGKRTARVPKTIIFAVGVLVAFAVLWFVLGYTSMRL